VTREATRSGPRDARAGQSVSGGFVSLLMPEITGSTASAVVLGQTLPS